MQGLPRRAAGHRDFRQAGGRGAAADLRHADRRDGLRLRRPGELRPARLPHHRRPDRQVLALHRLVAPAALGEADRLRDLRRHASSRHLSLALRAARRAGPHDLARRGDGGPHRHRDLSHASGGRLAAAEAAREEAAPARRPAGARRLARARGAEPRRAAQPRSEGRRDLRDRPAAAARRRGARAASHHPARLRALEHRARRSLPRSTSAFDLPGERAAAPARARAPRPSMRAPRPSF